MSLNIRLNPCPRCGGQNSYFLHKCNGDYPEPTPESYRIVCPDCNYQGMSVRVNTDPSTPYALRYSPEDARRIAAENWNAQSFPPWKMVISHGTNLQPDEEDFDP